MNKYTQLNQDGTTQLPDWVIANLGVTTGDLLEFKQEGDQIVVKRKRRDIHALVAKHARPSPFAPKTEAEFLEQNRADRGWDEEDVLAFERWEKSRQ
ncbi:MAG: hypothetical protein RLZZ156_2502 [Deinococcota bacterium]|jgi:antitoxin component of MazEF toxin-antitoxin module